MKGIVFTEFLEFVEMHHGYEMVDEILEEVAPQSKGIYTAVGSYPFSEMLALVMSFIGKSGIEINEALRLFGQHLFGAFEKNYPIFFEKSPNCFDFLASIDNYIHIEVAKLYPDAELPRFRAEKLSDTHMELFYQSERKLAPLARGLMEKALEHYNETASIDMEMLEADGSRVKFTIIKH